MPSTILQKMGLSSKPNPYMNPYHPGHVRFRKRPDTSASTSSSSSDAQPVNRTPPPRQPYSTQQSSSDMLAEARASAGRDTITGRSIQQRPTSNMRPSSSVSNLQQQYGDGSSTPQLSRISLVSSLDLYDYPLPPSPLSPSPTPPLPPPKSPKRQSQSQSSRNSNSPQQQQQQQHQQHQQHQHQQHHHHPNHSHHQQQNQRTSKPTSSRLSLADQLRQVEAEERTMYQNRSLAAPRTMGNKYELFTQEMARKRDEEMRIRVARGGVEYYAPERTLGEFYGAGVGGSVQ